MVQKWFFLCTSILLFSCNTKPINYNSEVEVIDLYSDLESMIDNIDSEVIVLNFWATTCPPCIKEMPHFNQLSESYSEEELKILLVSLDRASDLDSRVMPFVKRLEIKPEVVLLGDQNYSNWTEKIDESWYGALPATLIIRGDSSKYKFGAYETYEELFSDTHEIMEL